MAKRRSASTAIVRSFPFAAPRSPAPVIRISAPRARAVSAPKKKHHRRRSSASVGPISAKTLFAVGIGGAVLGYVEKQFPTLPTLPVIGRTGTIALAAYFLSKHGGMGSGIARDVAISAAAVSGYQLGTTGKISGDDVSGDIAHNVRGIAAQI